MSTTITSAIESIQADDEGKYLYFWIDDFRDPEKLFAIDLVEKQHRKIISLEHQHRMASLIVDAHRTRAWVEIEFEPHETLKKASIVLSVKEGDPGKASFIQRFKKRIKDQLYH